MINGTHFLLYSKNPEADRAFLRDVLEFRSVDAGRGWLIFALPPPELAVHPGDAMLGGLLYLMCDDLGSVIGSSKSKGVTYANPVEAEWGISTSVRPPSGGEIGLYQPTHRTMIEARST